MLIFNSTCEKPTVLENLLVGRTEVVDLIQQSILVSLSSNVRTHHLIIGPRGSGKTHLLRVLYNRIATNDQITSETMIAYMAEDEFGIDSFLSFLIRIMNSFQKWGSDKSTIDFWEKEIQAIKVLPPLSRDVYAVKVLREQLINKKLIIIVENLNEIFKGIKKVGQSKLRDFIQQYQNTIIIASCQALFFDIQNEDMPFYNFFHITHLKKLNASESGFLLKKLAENEKQNDIINFLDTTQGRGKIKSIHHLTEGNHRLVVLFYDFIKADFKNDLSVSFINVLDKLKPYYESFLRSLPPQQQKIVHFLALQRIPQKGSVISRQCLLTANITSKHMSDLQRIGFVSTYKKGRDNLYELSEPILRFCIELNENRDGIIGLFAQLISALYSEKELINKYLQYKHLAVFQEENTKCKYQAEYPYYEVALKKFDSAEEIPFLETCIEEIKNKASKEAIVFALRLASKRSYQFPQSEDFELNVYDIWKYLIYILPTYSFFNEAFYIIKHLLQKDDNRKVKFIVFPFLGQVYRYKIESSLFKKYIAELKLIIKDEVSLDFLVFLEEYIESNSDDTFLKLPKEARSMFSWLNESKIEPDPKIILKIDSAGDISERRKFINEGLNISPLPLQILIRQARLKEEEGKTSEAKDLLKKATKISDYNSCIVCSLANFNQRHGENIESKENFELAISNNQRCSEIRIQYARFIWKKLNNKELSNRYFNEAINLEPDRIENYLAYAKFLINGTLEYDKANSSYIKALKLDPKNIKALCDYSSFLIDKKRDLTAAKKSIGIALRHFPTNMCVLCLKARLNLENGNLDQGKKIFEELLIRDEECIKLETLWAHYLLYYFENINEARVLYEKILMNKKDSSLTMLEYINLLLLSGDFSLGSKYWHELSIDKQRHKALLLYWFISWVFEIESREISLKRIQELVEKGTRINKMIVQFNQKHLSSVNESYNDFINNLII
ncbi:MAG: hypothetical protein NTV01_14645 [Bacteroidia bacterium]|nr:hypothetical protein [Bacteroidia bacterium]